MTNFGRRQFFHSAIIGAAAFATPGVASDIIFRSGTGNPAKDGPSPLLLARAKAALETHRSRIQVTDRLAIADFSKPSREPRFYIVDLQSGQASAFLVAHGKGSDPSHSGWVQSFSNTHGSEATSAGAYMVGDTYFGQYGESRRLLGLEPQNDQAEARAIVIHPAWYVNKSLIQEQGKIGRSQGCFAFDQSDIGHILQHVAPGTLLFADKA